MGVAVTEFADGVGAVVDRVGVGDGVVSASTRSALRVEEGD
ncbi:hypothetical protein AB0K08_12510 [Citricoccus sp. NPDC055426]